MFFLTCMMLSASIAFAQTQVSGTIVSKTDGEPVIGAAIKVLGTSIGTVSDANGRFNLNVPAGSKQAEVSYVGMTTQTVTLKNGMRIVMEESVQAIDQVMVIAYGTQKKSAFTGSAAVVDAKEIGKVQVTNAIDALKGKASGIQIYTASGQPGETPTIRIRGVNSIFAGNDPLLVVDGSPYDGSFNDINPADVENITVLKDAASSALYGARGGNGVILITTKAGKRGENSKITVDAKWGANSKATPDHETVSSPEKYYEMWYTGLNNYAKVAQNMNDLQAWQWANNNLIDGTAGLGYNVFTTPEGQYLIGQNGKLNPNATLGRIVTNNGQQYLITPDDWTDETYRNSLRQEYTVTATGSTEKGSYYLSADYLSNDGITYASDYERFTSRLKADYMIKPWLKVIGNMSYSHTDRNYLQDDGSSGSSGNAFALTSGIAPIYPMYIRDAQGNKIFDQASGINLYDFGDRSVNGLYRPYLSQANPVAGNLLDTNNSNGNSFNGTGTIEITLPFGFKFTSINNVYLRESRQTNTTNPFFGQYASSDGIVYKYHTRSFTQNYQQRLNWHQQFGLNDIEVMLGHEYYKYNYAYLYGHRTKQFSPDNKELAGAVIAVTNNSYTEDYNTESWLGRAMYNYDEKYFGSISVMRQASSRFAKADGRWWGTFWSFGAGWLINKEKWFNVSWIDELKLKASYGENGNDLISDHLFTNRYSIVNANDEVSIVPSTTMKNLDITWEKNGKFNTGIDFSLFKGRLSGTVEYYRNTTKDMLFSFPLPPTLGYTSYYTNIGDMVNDGFEFDLRGDIIQSKDLTWSAYVNLTTNHNEITRLPQERKTMHLAYENADGFSSGSFFYAEGYSRYTYYTKKYAGVCNQADVDNSDGALTAADLGKAMYWKTIFKTNEDGKQLDEDGNIASETQKNPVAIGREKTVNAGEADYYLAGDVLPDVYGGFGTSVNFKGFDFSIDFQYQLGGKVYDGTYASLMGIDAGHAFSPDMLNAWTPENTNSNIPRLQYNDSYTNYGSDRFLTNASYLSLANITLGYTLPSKLTSRLGLGSVRVYAVADNVWTWSKRQGLDPRQSITGSNTGSYYSSIRTISGGISLTF